MDEIHVEGLYSWPVTKDNKLKYGPEKEARSENEKERERQYVYVCAVREGGGAKSQLDLCTRPPGYLENTNPVNKRRADKTVGVGWRARAETNGERKMEGGSSAAVLQERLVQAVIDRKRPARRWF